MTKQNEYRIKLDKNKITVIDENQRDYIKYHGWYAKKFCGNDYYAVAKIKGKMVALHNYIMRFTPNKKYTVDHINKDTLDNTKSNLRIVDKTTQCINRKMMTTNRTGVTGIRHRKNRWIAVWREDKIEKSKSFTYNDKKGCKKAFIDAFIYRKNKERELKSYRVALCLDQLPYSSSLISLIEPEQYFNEYMKRRHNNLRF